MQIPVLFWGPRVNIKFRKCILKLLISGKTPNETIIATDREDEKTPPGRI